VPFTLSHPAAAVPLARLRLPLSALVVGSMSPDFAYFLALSTDAHAGHTWAGVLAFCLPVGLAVLWTFHRVLKRPLLDLLPDAPRQRLAGAAGPFAFGPARRLGVVTLAVGLGAVTHVLWDAFTWHDRFGVHLFPGLREVVWSLPAEPGYGYDLYGYRVVQHVSTIVGAGLIAFWMARWYRRATAVPLASRLGRRERAAVWGAVLGGSAVVAATFALRHGDPFGYHWEVRAFVQMATIAGIPLVFAGLTAYALAWRFLLPDADAAEPPPPPRAPR